VTASDLVATVGQADGEAFVVLAAEIRIEVNGQPVSRAPTGPVPEHLPGLKQQPIEEDNMKFGMTDARTLSRAVGGQAMLSRSTGTFTPAGKYVAALSHYRTKLRNAPPSLDNDESAAR
jgi:hypothetical protein